MRILIVLENGTLKHAVYNDNMEYTTELFVKEITDQGSTCERVNFDKSLRDNEFDKELM